MIGSTVVLFLLLLMTTWNGATAAQSAATIRKNVQACRQQGFDPSRLACTTCDLLPTTTTAAATIQANCRACCQAYKSVDYRTRPYEAAVLVTWSSGTGAGAGSGGAVEELLRDADAWDEFVQQRGGSERLQVVERQLSMSDYSSLSQEMLLMLMKGGAPPAQVLLMDQKLIWSSTDVKGELSYETAAAMAKETFSLKDMNKDDIKDMLLTLLPAQPA